MIEIRKAKDGRLLKTTARELEAQGLKYCPRCERVLALNDYPGNKKRASKTGDICNECTRAISGTSYRTHGRRWAEKRKAFKAELVALLGGRCVRCGYSEFLSGLDFHHVNGDDKDSILAAMLSKHTTGREIAIAEADKCALLCRNCHTAYHAGEWQTEWQRRTNGFGYTLKGSFHSRV